MCHLFRLAQVQVPSLRMHTYLIKIYLRNHILSCTLLHFFMIFRWQLHFLLFWWSIMWKKKNSISVFVSYCGSLFLGGVLVEIWVSFCVASVCSIYMPSLDMFIFSIFSYWMFELLCGVELYNISIKSKCVVKKCLAFCDDWLRHNAQHSPIGESK